ncbi:MAG: division/cell wall cluster transcriptional repressor MraZ [Clostridia bacterium]|nr:division/cell wall cluster transcriptional repressor MraZ [Clostridia bacterium]
MTFLNEYRHSVDPKNRLFIPAKFREELGETFYVTRKIMDKCLAVYSEAEWTRFSEKLKALPESQVGKIKLFIFSKTVQVSPDSHGRILLPAQLLQYAGIEKSVVIAGAGDHVQIWDEATWDANEKDLNLEEIENLFCQLGL